MDSNIDRATGPALSRGNGDDMRTRTTATLWLILILVVGVFMLVWLRSAMEVDTPSAPDRISNEDAVQTRAQTSPTNPEDRAASPSERASDEESPEEEAGKTQPGGHTEDELEPAAVETGDASNDEPGTDEGTYPIRIHLRRPMPIEDLREIVAGLTKIDRLSVRGSELTAEAALALGDFPIDVMQVSAPEALNREALNVLSSYRNVTRLHLTSGIAGKASNAIPGSRVLEDYERSVIQLVQMEGLTHLELTRQSLLTDPILEAIGKSTTIRRLVIRVDGQTTEGVTPTDSGFLALGQMSQLEAFELYRFKHLASAIDIDTIGSLVTSWGRLVSLALPYWHVSDREIEKWGLALERLKYLDVRNTLITDAGYARIGRHWKLEELLPSKQFGDLGAAAVSRLMHLRRLELAYSAVGSNGFRAIIRGDGPLNTLCVTGCYGIDGTAVHELVESTLPLEYLYVDKIEGVTKQIIRDIAARFELIELGIGGLASVDEELLEEMFSFPRLERVHVPYCEQITRADAQELNDKYDSYLLSRGVRSPDMGFELETTG